jgi:hypothetical protein
MYIGFLMNISAQQQQSLNGIWHSTVTGYSEELGNYEINQVLTIQNGEYSRIYKRIIQRKLDLSTDEKGSVYIIGDEIIFLRYENKQSQLYLLWEFSEEQMFRCNYFLNNNSLTIKNGDELVIFTKK